ncbi:uncharacterized protein LOC126887113 [Diabrotica virgifera virgifera]|uniref:RNA-directed DNA polymerase n=1 Tax=Diabrotica virgifera virgifera TaxID=50390 RepID=A0ABM5KJX3_DIAVI|nr:uncharacterized protein LOC126887113 [Diabrotica virgifera virgifera]
MATNLGMGSVKLPPDFDLQGQNAATEWKFWYTAFEDYLIAIGQHESTDRVKLSLLRNIMGTESARIMTTFKIPDDQVDKYDYMIETISKYVNPRMNECFERYNFLKRTQKEGEVFEHFLTDCRHLVRTCNYNRNDPDETAEDKALRDKIVMGIRDTTTREALLRIDKLTLEKAISFCRTSEQSKSQNLQFQSTGSNETGFEVNEIRNKKTVSTKILKSNKNLKQGHEKISKSTETFRCKRCQTQHGPRKCPAYGKACNKCGILNHFSKSCRVKNVKNVEHEDGDSSSEIFVDNVNLSNNVVACNSSRGSIWEEFLEIEGRKIKTKLDTGADVNIIPLKIFKYVNKQFRVRPTEYILKAFEGTVAKPIGIVNLNCKFKNKEIFEDFVIVEGANQVLIGGQACLHLNLIKRINIVSTDKFQSDMLSRASLKVKTLDLEMLEMVHTVSIHLPMSDERKLNFRRETANDKILKKISDFYYNGWPRINSISPLCKPYYVLKNDLYVEAGLIFMGDKIVVPNSLKSFILNLIHKGHLGINKTIHKARQLFFWPNMSSDITLFIKQCRTCEKYMPSNRREPLLPHSVPKLRFNKIGADILEFGAKAYLILIDHFSHWIEICPLQNKTSESVIDAMQNAFTKFGYPQHLIADNLPFVSLKCREYYKNKDITVSTCTPYHHQSNGLSEKAVSLGKQILRKSLAEKSDFRDLLLEYNNTPIISLKASPAQILQSRTLRTQIPVTQNKLEPEIQVHIVNYLNEQKQKMKIHYDKTSPKSLIEYKKGDKVVVKSNRDKIWYKAVVLEKAREPRAYWIRKESNNKVIRRNSSQLKPSLTKSNYDAMLEPELFPDQYIPEQKTYLNNQIAISNNDIVDDINLLFRTIDVNKNEQVISDPGTSGYQRSRFGRSIKPPVKLDL